MRSTCSPKTASLVEISETSRHSIEQHLNLLLRLTISALELRTSQKLDQLFLDLLILHDSALLHVDVGRIDDNPLEALG